MDKKRLGNAFLIAWGVIMAAGTVLMFIGITRESLWYDESYSAAIVNHSIPDIINMTAGDSHPPLYYLMLHVFTLVFGRSVLALRAFSALGAVALAAWGFGPVRRALGNRFALIYTFVTFALPITFSMAQEARMYTWAAFFVTGSALYGYLAYKDGLRRDWIIFGLCTLAAAYTHYYALLAAVIICVIIFIAMLIEKKRIVPFLCSAGAAAAGYVPWVFILAGQMGRVGSNFWIPPVTGEVIRNTLVYPFSNKFSYKLSSPLSDSFVDAALYVSAAFILFGIIFRIIKKDQSVKLAVLAAAAFILTIGAGIIASSVIRPVLVERYMVTVLGLFILALSFGIGALGKRVLPIAGCAVILALSLPQTGFVIKHRENGPMAEAQAYLDPLLEPGDVFLHTDEHTMGTFCYYFPGSMNYYYQQEGYYVFSNFDALKPNGVVIGSLGDIGKDKRVWLVRRLGTADNTAARLLRSGELKLKGNPKEFSADISWYRFSVYQTLQGAEKASAAAPGAASSGDLTVSVSGLNSNAGKAFISVYVNDPSDAETWAEADIKDGKAEAKFTDLPFGEYAILVFHDKNGNRQLDMAGEVPGEGIGYSNTLDAPQGPPDYETCKFTFDANNTAMIIPVFYFDAV